jgi:hypothetical protein
MGRKKRMPFTVVVDPAQLAILTAALDDFCRIGDIRAGTPEHEEAGLLIQSLYNKGATTAEALSAAIENMLRREEPQIAFVAIANGFQASTQHDR